MSKSVNVSRIVSLLVVLMAAVVVFSGPVAEVLDLPSPTAEAKKKHKKKKKKRRPAFNVVQCAIGQSCFGTDGKDRLVGTDSTDFIFGGEGNDVYQGNSGDNELNDDSLTSSDTYTGYEPSFAGFFLDIINDQGGSADFLDLSSLRMLDDVALIRLDVPGTDADDLELDGPGDLNDIVIDEHFGQGRIEKIQFANGTVTGTQAQSLAREATPEEQKEIEEQRAELEESLPEEERPNDNEHPPEDGSSPQEEE